MIYGPFRNLHGDILHPESPTASELRSDSDKENKKTSINEKYGENVYEDRGYLV